MRSVNLGKKIALILQALVLMFGFVGASLATAGTAVATPATGDGGSGSCVGPGTLNINNGANCAANAGATNNLFIKDGIFNTVANTLVFIVGAVSVVFLIIGGLRYVISNGDSKGVEAAKNTILFSVIGIVVAVIAFALVQFVIGALAPTS